MSLSQMPAAATKITLSMQQKVGQKYIRSKKRAHKIGSIVLLSLITGVTWDD